MVPRLVIKQALPDTISSPKVHRFDLRYHLSVELLQPSELVAGL
jgi:hypothetical protein